MKKSNTHGPLADLEKHLPNEWWKTLFNAIYIKTDGDVVENDNNTTKDIDHVLAISGVKKSASILDLCCGQGRHTLELAKRGYTNLVGIDRSRYLIRLAKKRAIKQKVAIKFSEGDARKIRLDSQSVDLVTIMGNSFGYFEQEEDDRNVLKEIKRILKPKGTILIDITDGEWTRNNFEARSWEWINQAYFVCRERSLSSEGRRIISREVVVDATKGVIADQFYAERLYSFEELKEELKSVGFTNITNHGTLQSESSRNQDLGMMQHRVFISAKAPDKKERKASTSKTPILVVMGDPKLPDSVKKDGVFNKEDFHTISELKKALKTLKEFQFTYINNHKSLISELEKQPKQLVLNLCDEGYYNHAELELHIPAILDMYRFPFTGAGAKCLAMCFDKSLVIAIAQSMDIPSPEETYIEGNDQSATLPNIFPALLKPNCGDSSLGITQNAVVHNAEQLMKHMAFIRQISHGTPILVQEFLNGTEYSVGIVGNPENPHCLPILEVDYSALPSNLPKILSYESKWDPDSPYWTSIAYKEAVLREDEHQKLIDYSLKLFSRLSCQDYARFDFRKDANGVIKLLEVNPNPGWCWDGKLNLMAEMDGMTYSELLSEIIHSARQRHGLTQSV
ncbi:MAG: methyltransferase domain-containing protein [bacterium]|nr:methyltransferase domain-containing protein [bacterium]